MPGFPKSENRTEHDVWTINLLSISREGRNYFPSVSEQFNERRMFWVHAEVSTRPIAVPRENVSDTLIPSPEFPAADESTQAQGRE